MFEIGLFVWVMLHQTRLPTPTKFCMDHRYVMDWSAKQPFPISPSYDCREVRFDGKA